MEAKLAFWSAALINMLFIVALSATGIVSVRRGNVARHRRCMKTAACLVAAFLTSYGIKLMLLGREDLGSWSAGAVWNLRAHETCVLAMVLGGAVALTRARRMRLTRNVSLNPSHPAAPGSVVRWHRRAGWTATIGAVLGFATAAVVLAGMFERLSA